MDEDIEFEPVVQIEVFSSDRRAKIERTNVTSKYILERVRLCLYILGDDREAMAALINTLPEDETAALVIELSSVLNSAYYVRRANAIFLLGLLGARARSAISDIVQSMSCWNSRVTMEAAEALPKIDVSMAVSALASGFYKIPPPNGTSLAWCNQDESIVQCLEALGPAALPAAPNLCAYLHFMGRTNHALISIGAEAIPYVLTEVRRSNAKRLPQTCRNAAEIFSAIGVEARLPLLDALQCLVDDRLPMAMIFSFLEPPALSDDAVIPLRRLLSDPSVKTYAEQALAKLELTQQAQDTTAKVLAAVRSGRYIASATEAVSSTSVHMPTLANLTETQKEKLASQLTESVNSYKQIEQINALYVLGLLGQSAHSVTATIVQALARMDCRAVVQAADTLYKIGAAHAVPELLAALPAEAERMIVNSLGRTDESVVECLELFAESFSESSRGSGSETSGGASTTDFSSRIPFLAAFLATRGFDTLLARIGPAAIPAIINEVKRVAVRKSFTRTCEGAANVLNAIGAAASQPLVDALVSSSPDTQEAFTLVFANLRPPALSLDAVPELSRLAFDQVNRRYVASNARAALATLGRLAAPVIFEQFFSSLTHDRPGQKSKTQIFDELLKQFGPSAISSLVAYLPNVDSTKQAILACAILRIDPHNIEAAGQLLTLLKSDNAKVRLEAVQGVAQIYCRFESVGLLKDILVPQLKEAWCDPDASVRQAASNALEQLLSRNAQRELLASVSIARSKRDKETT